MRRRRRMMKCWNCEVSRTISWLPVRPHTRPHQYHIHTTEKVEVHVYSPWWNWLSLNELSYWQHTLTTISSPQWAMGWLPKASADYGEIASSSIHIAFCLVAVLPNENTHLFNGIISSGCGWGCGFCRNNGLPTCEMVIKSENVKCVCVCVCVCVCARVCVCV